MTVPEIEGLQIEVLAQGNGDRETKRGKHLSPTIPNASWNSLGPPQNSTAYIQK